MIIKVADPGLYPLLVEDARRMRNNPTEAERTFWEMARRKNLGVLFRRQYVIDQYIVDFVSFEAKLVVEIDGEYHAAPEQQEWDRMRTQVLERIGFKVLRYTNKEVLFDTERVYSELKKEISDLLKAKTI